MADRRDWIAFGGTAAQVQAAFKTEIHHYLVNGQMHYANVTPPSIPMARSSLASCPRYSRPDGFPPESPPASDPS